MKKISIGLLLAAFAAFGDSCALEPLKPLVPLGCRDLRAQCECFRDENGNKKCRWVWICVKD